MASKPAFAFAPIALPQIETTPQWLSTLGLLAADMVALSTVYWLTVFGHYALNHGYTLRFYLNSFPGLGLYLVAFALFGLYPGVLLHPAEELRRVYLGVTTAVVVFASIMFLSRTSESYSRVIYLMTWVVGAPVVLLGRHLVRKNWAKHAWWGQRAIVLGSNENAQRLIRSLNNSPAGLRIIGVLAEEYGNWPEDLPPILGYCGSSSDSGLGSHARYVIVALSHKAPDHVKMTIQRFCRGFRHIVLVPELPGISSLGITACDLGGQTGFEFPQRLFQPSARLAKRVMDIIFSAVMLAVLLPVLLMTALLVRFTSRGPILFGHLRYGRDGKSFKAWKFRTMVENADQVLRTHLSQCPESRMAWQLDHKLKNDPRITPPGKWLRRYSFDELPQLWNVLMGHMSLVGPRPIVAAEIQKYGDGYDLYTRVPPGITGLWQVSGRNNTTYEKRVAFDEYYVCNWSIWMDLYILVCTIKVILTAEGAY